MYALTFRHRIFAAQGANLMDKGSACVEAFQEINRQVCQLFGADDRSRRHEEVKFERDVEALVTHYLSKKLYTKTSGRAVEDLDVKRNTAKGRGIARGSPAPIIQTGEREYKSAVVDFMEVGASLSQGGKFDEFIHTTAIDVKIGYAKKSVFGTDSRNGFDKLAGKVDEGDGDLSTLPGVGGLGGGAYN